MPATGGPERDEFQYAVIRLVPRVERGERMNVGVVLFCRRRGFLAVRMRLDQARLRALAPECDPETVRPHLDAIAAVAAGEPDAGPLAALSASERFGWIVAPSSTAIQPSEVHTGLCEDPQATLDKLFRQLVEG